MHWLQAPFAPERIRAACATSRRKDEPGGSTSTSLQTSLAEPPCGPDEPALPLNHPVTRSCETARPAVTAGSRSSKCVLFDQPRRHAAPAMRKWLNLDTGHAHGSP